MSSSKHPPHKKIHYLSQAASSSSNTKNNKHQDHGWVEGISNLTEDSPATNLLDTMAKISKMEITTKSNLKDEVNYLMLKINKLKINVCHDDNGNGDNIESKIAYSIALMEKELDAVGEVIMEIGYPNVWGTTTESMTNLNVSMSKLKDAAESNNADVTVMRERAIETSKSKDINLNKKVNTVDILVRKRMENDIPPIELRVALIGNVDSGKSTLVGVLTRSILDDGRGFARSKVFKHLHEQDSGRTSSIGQHSLFIDSKMKILNDPLFKNTNCSEYVQKASKVITLVDLAGHERYFKTTAYGLTGHLPDYACVIVGANAGIVGMCKEHFGVAMALKIPCFFVITKVDICPEHVFKNSIQTLTTILKKPGAKKKPYIVKNISDVLICVKTMHVDSLAPIFLTSSVTGKGLDLVKLFINLLQQKEHWKEKRKESVEFIIDEIFGVPGVGTIVAGTLKKGVIKNNSTLLMGPDMMDAEFKPISIKSIHYKRRNVSQVVAGQTASLALKKIKRGSVRKGMVLLGPQLRPRAVWEFDADIAILTHSTTIHIRYQAMIHCEIVKQSAKVVAMEKELLRSGDRAVVRFHFLQRPEYLSLGSRFVFREGRTKGIGVIINIVNKEDQIVTHE